MLQQSDGYNKTGVHALFPYVPWERARTVVVDENENDSLSGRRRSTGVVRVEGGLEQILNFPPLLRAFDDFCVKALCIEVRQTRFIVLRSLSPMLLTIQEPPSCTQAIEQTTHKYDSLVFLPSLL